MALYLYPTMTQFSSKAQLCLSSFSRISFTRLVLDLIQVLRDGIFRFSGTVKLIMGNSSMFLFQYINLMFDYVENVNVVY